MGFWSFVLLPFFFAKFWGFACLKNGKLPLTSQITFGTAFLMISLGVIMCKSSPLTNFPAYSVSQAWKQIYTILRATVVITNSLSCPLKAYQIFTKKIEASLGWVFEALGPEPFVIYYYLFQCSTIHLDIFLKERRKFLKPSDILNFLKFKPKNVLQMFLFL